MVMRVFAFLGRPVGTISEQLEPGSRCSAALDGGLGRDVHLAGFGGGGELDERDVEGLGETDHHRPRRNGLPESGQRDDALKDALAHETGPPVVNDRRPLAGHLPGGGGVRGARGFGQALVEVCSPVVERVHHDHAQLTARVAGVQASS
jgi:hypothetical protein